ncbi:MAG: flagellar basal body P-ring protein FlgI [Bryobacteraceae bacterium]|nr:flagellar basal body P-ring protein FlgI [Bryobacteraceae bacterium]
MLKTAFFLCSLLHAAAPAPRATRVKELIAVEGVRDNQLIGYGLVVGLQGTGDKRQTVFSAQTLSNMLEKMGVQVNPLAFQVRNMAAVMVTANLPPFAQPGMRIDLTAAALGDATNLQGGILLATPLRGLDGQIYAMAQGSVITGGFAAKGAGASATLNHPTSGRLPSGAIVERASPAAALGTTIRLQLRQADFTTAARIAAVVNERFGPGRAFPESSGAVRVETPPEYAARAVDFMAALESLTVQADRVARIVVNERTGTIVMGKEVKISPVAVMHGALSIEVQTNFDISQPAPFSGGVTTVVPNTTVQVKEEKAKSLVLKAGATVEELVRALQSIGATARDVMAILQNLKAAAALEADLEVI